MSVWRELHVHARVRYESVHGIDHEHVRFTEFSTRDAH